MRRVLLALLLTAPVEAKLAQTAPDGFISTSDALVALPPTEVWSALINWSGWWDPAHSYSGTLGAMVLQAQAGSALIERWPGGSVSHASVLSAMPGSLLRLTGGFGPLQALPVTATLDFALKPEGTCTRLVMTYRVAGSAADRLDTLAAPVDAVMSAGFARLVRFANTGNPAER